jgi:hypothetical protein
MDSESWFVVDVFEPKMTTPPSRAMPSLLSIAQ